jgi:hypothetical protein
MSRLVLIAAAFFVAFAAVGFTVGRSVVTSEPYMLAQIAQGSAVKLSGGQLMLELSDAGAPPYWKLDLANNRPAFQTADAMMRSFDGKSLSAQSNLLLGFASGGAATTTAATVYKKVLETKESGDWKTFAAMAIGGVSGYFAGYYAAMQLSKPSDKEIQLALRKPETVEKVKKYVFLSLLKKRGFDFNPTVVEQAAIDQACGQFKDRTEWVKCSEATWAKSGNAERLAYRQGLIQSAQEALSNDKVDLKGTEFLVFVL